MSLVGVREYLKAYGLDDKILELPESSATVHDAAHALHTEEDRIAKSLSLLVNDRVVVLVVSGCSRIDNHKFKVFFHKKAKMIPGPEVEALTSHPVGGVCPFALPEGTEVYLDESLRRYDKVYPACGSTNSAIELSLEDLERASQPIAWVDVTETVLPS